MSPLANFYYRKLDSVTAKAAFREMIADGVPVEQAFASAQNAGLSALGEVVDEAPLRRSDIAELLRAGGMRPRRKAPELGRANAAALVELIKGLQIDPNGRMGDPRERTRGTVRNAAEQAYLAGMPQNLGGLTFAAAGSASFTGSAISYPLFDCAVMMDTGGILETMDSLVIDGGTIPLGPVAGGLPAEIFDAQTFNQLPVFVGTISQNYSVGVTASGAGKARLYCVCRPGLVADFKRQGLCCPEPRRGGAALDLGALMRLIEGGGGDDMGGAFSSLNLG